LKNDFLLKLVNNIVEDTFILARFAACCAGAGFQSSAVLLRSTKKFLFFYFRCIWSRFYNVAFFAGTRFALLD